MTATSDPFAQEDEVDLAEIFLGLWSQKTLVGFVTFTCLVASVIYALRATPTYESISVFEISGEQSQPRFSSDFGGLANLAGFGIRDGNQNLGVFDRLQGRDFVLGVATELALDQDPYFNPLSSEDRGKSFLGGLKGVIKTLLAPSPGDGSVGEEPLARNAIVEKFTKVVTAGETENGSIRIAAVHNDPVRAAAVANTTMNRLLAALDTERKNEQAKQLAYLSEQLADALSEMNFAQARVQDFALENSVVSTSAFATRSDLMSRLRDELRDSREMNAATVKLLALSRSEEHLTQVDYAALRGAFPIVDDVTFRRLLGIPDALDQWTWPRRDRLQEFQNILLDRLARARREIAQLQVEAEDYAKSSEKLTALERDASVAEATYQLLSEQTKAQAFAAGFNSDIANIYQVAVPSTRPSAPRKTLIVALGGVLGLFLGSGLAIARGALRGRIYSANAIKEAAQAKLSVRSPLRFLRSRKIGKLVDRAQKMRPGGLAALAIDLNEKLPQGILCVSTGSQTRATGPATWVAAHLARDNPRVAVVDLSGDLSQGETEGARSEAQLWQVSPVTVKIDLISPAAPLRSDDLLLRRSFREDIRELMARYDRVVIAAAPDHAAMARRALYSLSFYLIAICSGGLARKSILAELREVAPIDACLSES